MHSLPILRQLPPGYFVEEAPRGILAIDADVARAFHQAGFGPETNGEFKTSDLAGRKPLFEMECGGERFVMRRFHHGGLLRWITRERFLHPERPFAELIASDALRKSGVPTPRVVAARARIFTGIGWGLDVITRRVADTQDLGAVLDAIGDGEVSLVDRFALARALGTLVRRLHRVGLLHADLQVKNVLVQWAEGESGREAVLWVLDLDGSFFVENPTRAERRRNLRRLYRSARRREAADPFLSRSDFARFLLGYRPEGGSWKEDWRAIQASHARRSLGHLLGWWLERRFAGPRAARA